MSKTVCFGSTHYNSKKPKTEALKRGSWTLATLHTVYAWPRGPRPMQPSFSKKQNKFSVLPKFTFYDTGIEAKNIR